MPITLYGFPVSQPTRSVLILLSAGNIQYEYVNIDIRTGEQKQEAFLKINPNGQVPALKHDDFVLTEGAAILQYLAENVNDVSGWYPKDPHTRARTNQWLHWAHTTFQFHLFVTFIENNNKNI